MGHPAFVDLRLQEGCQTLEFLKQIGFENIGAFMAQSSSNGEAYDVPAFICARKPDANPTPAVLTTTAQAIRAAPASRVENLPSQVPPELQGPDYQKTRRWLVHPTLAAA